MPRIQSHCLRCSNRKVITLAEYQSLEEAELEEEGSDKEVHLVEVKEECVEEVMMGSCLFLGGP